MSRTVLIYHASRAMEYAELVRPLLPEAHLIPCATAEQAASVIGEAEVLFSWRFPLELFRQAPRLRWVQAMGAGVEDLVTAPLPDGCLLTRVEGLFGGYMSEYAFLHMLAHAQQLRRSYTSQTERRWDPYQIGKLAGKRLGIAGTGSIGAEMVRKGKAFGMEVWALTRSSGGPEGTDRLFATGQAEAFTAGVDYLVSTLPLTPQTVGLIDPRRMKPGSLLINVGRGATIDEEALLEAVRTGRIEAVLDVFAHEPLPADHPFWRTKGITVTPHISGPSVPAEVAAYFAENYRRYEAARPLVGQVDRNRGY